MALETNILDRLLGLNQTNFTVVDVKDSEHEIVFRIKHRQRKYQCRICGGHTTSCHSKKIVTLHDMPWGSKRVKWLLDRAMILCPCSYWSRTESIPFRAKNHRLTQRFVDYIEQLLCTKMFTVMDVARMLHLDYGVIYKIDHEVLKRLIQDMEIPDPINISVDEKSFKKRHNYVTIVTDADIGKAIWCSVGNSKKSLDEFFMVLGADRCKKIKTVSKDLHRPYAESCREFIPQAIEVADPFHVIQRLNKTIEECRKELIASNDIQKENKDKIKSSIWVLRHKQINMSDQLHSKLNQLKKVNEPLYTAYLHKEMFYEIFNFKPSEILKAESFLNTWLQDASLIKFNAFQDFCNYVNRNKEVILNIIREKRNSAISEGINRKITVLKSMAYGYHNINYFMLKILQRCGVLGKFWKPEHKMEVAIIS